MDKEQGFAGELQTLKADVETDVGRYLQLLREKPSSKKDAEVDAARSEESNPEPASESKAEMRRLRIKSRKSRTVRVKEATSLSTRPLAARTLVNVTTRLSAETNDRLTAAALRQKLRKRRPDSRQEIVEVAVREWLDKSEY